MESAERLLDLAHRVDPDPDRAHLREAMFARDLEELRFLATSGIETQPAGTIALLAIALLRLEERDLALAVFRAGIEQHPDDFELLYVLARQLTLGPVDPGVPRSSPRPLSSIVRRSRFNPTVRGRASTSPGSSTRAAKTSKPSSNSGRLWP